MTDHGPEIEATLRAWPASFRQLLAESGALIEAPANAMVFGPGDPCGGFVTPLSGVIRVTQIAASGRAITLYRVGPGDSCVLTTSCLLEDIPYGSYGYAEGPLRALALPPDLFHGLLDRDPAFRKSVFAIYSRRILEMAGVIEDFLVHRADQKLINRLLSQDGDVIRTTHERLAADIGTAREVVSRLLKEFERQGLVALDRGRVEIRDRQALTSVVQSL